MSRQGRNYRLRKRRKIKLWSLAAEYAKFEKAERLAWEQISREVVHEMFADWIKKFGTRDERELIGVSQ